jgi:hypothetical protein
MIAIKREYRIDRQGKEYVLYAGLLDAAHGAGLRRIETELVQAPGPQNGHVAICSARVTLVDGDGVERTFGGIGDADTSNVNRQMTNVLIRMAETRAKARALRDAINVAEAAVEEDAPPVPAEPMEPLPARPGNDASAREWHTYLAFACRRFEVEVPDGALLLAADAPDDDVTRKNAVLAKALRAAGKMK